MLKNLKRFDVPKMALPLILSNIAVPLLGLTDSIVMGHLHSAYFLAAVGFGAVLFDFIFWSFGFLRTGTTAFIAQAFGRGDLDACVRVFLRALCLGLGIALVVLLAQWPIALLIRKALWTRVHLVSYVLSYFHVRIWSVPATLMSYVLIAWFLSIKKTRYCLYITALTVGVAIVGDLVFVFGLHMTVTGVALADVLGRYVGVFYGIFLFLSDKRAVRYLTWDIFQLSHFKELMALNRDLFIRTFGLMCVLLFVSFQGAHFGKNILAANTVLMNLIGLMAFAQDGFNNTAEILVGNSIGQKNKPLFWESIRATAWWSLVVALVATLLFACLGRYFIGMITSIPSVIQVATYFLPFVIISPLISIWCFWLDGVFMGAAWGKQLRNGMCFSVVGFIIVWYFLRPFENMGLWIALQSFYIGRGVSMGFFFWRKTARGII